MYLLIKISSIGSIKGSGSRNSPSSLFRDLSTIILNSDAGRFSWVISVSPGADTIQIDLSFDLNSSIELAREFLEKTKIDLSIDSIS